MEEEVGKRMEILVIGNGFDLAHNLPTTYADFLEFIRVIKDLLYGESLESVNWGKLNQKIKYEIGKHVRNSSGSIFENKVYSLNLINNNIWVEYFSQTFINETWIDFESAIATIIKSLDVDMYDKRNERREPLKAEMQNLSNEFLEQCYKEGTFLVDVEDKRITFEEIRNILLKDLNNLIYALEIYLSEYVNKIKVTVESPDIKGMNPDKILSFNYTDTYERVYSQKNNIEFDFIHGKADIYNNVDINNLVLGIDEYLPEDRRNHEVDLIAFKKFYQRIHKRTGCLYKDWVSEIHGEYVDYLYKVRNALHEVTDYIDNGISLSFKINDALKLLNGKTETHNVYIFGHSLDITDKDILRDLILNNNVQTTIFYHNKDVYGQQIANLVKVIGQDELIRRTGGPDKTITFRQQQRPMENKT
ncbi:AbiH family protein [Anaerocolumna sp. AGMB13020]|uniref:AbiH family protein n=1 Tax=Anaerocolumna sp. AGMB13020 TaxID=3081750 RepID=UPI002952A5F7|nr:AbiH family protein [Anaerocolumna sp. AGMB13020]WOO35801.1 AbiH family protein [Anaerocolumna sp. AGMB13020]